MRDEIPPVRAWRAYYKATQGQYIAATVLSLFVVGKLVLFEGAGRVCVPIVSFGTRSSACFGSLEEAPFRGNEYLVCDTWYQVPRFMILFSIYWSRVQYEKSYIVN